MENIYNICDFLKICFRKSVDNDYLYHELVEEKEEENDHSNQEQPQVHVQIPVENSPKLPLFHTNPQFSQPFP